MKSRLPLAALLLLAGLLLLPLSSLADDPETDDGELQDDAEEFVDPFGESPFGESPGERLPLGEDPETSEVLRPLVGAPVDDLEPPSEPVALRFRFDEPMRMDVNNSSRMGFDQRPDLRQIYHSGMALEYTPISHEERDALRAWPIASDDREAPDDAVPVLVTIYEFSGTFESPHELTDSARTHQILKDAAFSYLISPRGQVYDFRVHPPTNPLARASLEDLQRLITGSHPLLPDEPVEPGDTWTDSIELAFEEGNVVKTQDVTLTYRFERWGRCDMAYCALIEVDLEVKAAGRLTDGDFETQSGSVGTSSGWILFDHETGRVVRSRFELDTQGNTTARRRVGDTIEDLATARFNLNVLTRMELLDRRLPSYELVPLED